MKVLLISDVHSNIYALEAIERVETWDEVWCCGDLVDFGPFPMEAIGWITDHHAKVVVGNHDMTVMSLTPELCSLAYEESRWGWCHHNRERMSLEAVEYLKSLPVTLELEADGYKYQMQHRYDNGYGTVQTLDQFDRFWNGAVIEGEKRRLLFGHTHRRGMHILGENEEWLNPGSASYRRPDDPDKRAQYMVIEDGKVRFGAVAYDRTPLLIGVQEAHRCGRMVENNLQDTYFFFGSAATTRDPLPPV